MSDPTSELGRLPRWQRSRVESGPSALIRHQWRCLLAHAASAGGLVEGPAVTGGRTNLRRAGGGALRPQNRHRRRDPRGKRIAAPYLRGP
jgi:hypothetical protein